METATTQSHPVSEKSFWWILSVESATEGPMGTSGDCRVSYFRRNTLKNPIINTLSTFATHVTDNCKAFITNVFPTLLRDAGKKVESRKARFGASHLCVTDRPGKSGRFRHACPSQHGWEEKIVSNKRSRRQKRLRSCTRRSYLPVIRRKRVRMMRSVKPPTAAVTMTSTCPWSDARSDAAGGVERGTGGKRGESETKRRGNEM